MAVKCILTGQTPSVLDGVTENVQTQLNDKVDKVTGKGLSANDYTNAEKTKLSGIETGAQKNTITGVKGSAETTYRTGNVNITATNIGLGNVDNTSDANKPISNATQTALNNKQSKITANGILKGDGTGAVTAAEETEVELVDLPQEVFWATYGQTTAAELNAAWDAGKVIKLKQGQLRYELGLKYGTQSFQFYTVFTNFKSGPIRRATLKLVDGTWEQDIIGYICDIAISVSLPTASWTGSDPYTQTVTISASTANTKVDIQPSEELYDQLVADSVGYLAIKNVDGTLTAVAKGGKPSVKLTVQVTYNNVY